MASTEITSDVIRSWVAQLLDPSITSLVVDRDGQIEVRLYANRGKVRKTPMVVLNGGPSEMTGA